MVAPAMEDQTCPKCNVDVDPVELKQNNLVCPTCGFDMSDAAGSDDVDEEEWDEDEESDDAEEDEDEE